jgi:hypothetical protein
MDDMILGYIPNPLLDKFSLGELIRVAPWVYEDIQAVGPQIVKGVVRDMGLEPEEPQAMTTWVSAVTQCHSALWNSLAQG